VPGLARAGGAEIPLLCRAFDPMCNREAHPRATSLAYSQEAAELLASSDQNAEIANRLSEHRDWALRTARLGDLDPRAIRGGVRPAVNACLL
jgi:hypothetical protein